MFRRKSVGKAAPPRATSGTFSRLQNWIVDTLGLQVSDVPSRLTLPNITPVMEQYRPQFLQIRPVQPAAGAGFAQAIPVGEAWELVSLLFRLTTDANVANRAVRVLDFATTSQAAYETAGNYTHVASTIADYVMAAHGVVGNVLTQPFPLDAAAIVMLPAPVGYVFYGGHRIVIDVANIAAGDQLSLITGVFKVWTVPQVIRGQP